LEHLKNDISATIKTLGSLAAFGEIGAKYKELINALSTNDLSRLQEWNEMFNVIHTAVTENIGGSKVLLPSALITVLQKNVENFLSDLNVRRYVSDQILVIVPCDKSIAHQFVCDYVLALILKVVKFVRSSMQQNKTHCAVLTKEIEFDVEDLEAIHYIGGSTIRSFYKKSQQFPKNSGWAMIGRVITQRLLESDNVPGPPQIVKGWTIAQNRGSLFFVSGVLFDFLCGVTEILEKDSSTQGVNHDFVLEQVCNSGFVLLWDEAISDSLPEELAYNFMKGMVRSFSQTFGVGKAKKILNAARKKAEASVPLRHKVAPR